MHIHLLRCKAELRAQSEAFSVAMKPSDVLVESFLARPSAQVMKGTIWHIGNTKILSNGNVFFALGRESLVKDQKFDQISREFGEIESSRYPFTFGVFDPLTQVAGVIIRAGVSLSADDTAKRLNDLLIAAGVGERANREVIVDFIPDPEGFIDLINRAANVIRFDFEFSPPNPPRTDELIQEPLRRFAERASAEKGKATVSGESLNKDALIDLTKAVAATGDNATARIRDFDGAPSRPISLQRNSLRHPLDFQSGEDIGLSISRAMDEAFNQLRPVQE